VLVGTTLWVVAVAGCIHETHVVGEGRADGSPEATGDASAGLGGATGHPPALDAGSADVTPVVPLGGASTGGWPIAISPEEVARRLSQFVFRKPPSAALTAAIVATAPRTNEDVGALTDGLLLDETSLAGRQAFYRWWLSLDTFAVAPRDATLFPTFTEDVRAALIAQTLMFAEDVTWRPQGDLAALLTEPAAFVTDATAPWFLNVSVPPGASATRVMLDQTEYAGIVTQPAVVATVDHPERAAPSARGTRFLGRYLCQPVANIAAIIPPLPVVPGMTIRQVMEQVASSCGYACHHTMIDPPGFAFGHFDAVGAFHEKEGDLPVDTSGGLSTWWRQTNEVTLSLPFTGIADLARQVAGLPEVATCFAQKWLVFSMGKDGEAPSEFLRPGAAQIADADYVVKRATIQGHLNLRGTIRAVTETHTFLDP